MGIRPLRALLFDSLAGGIVHSAQQRGHNGDEDRASHRAQ